MFRDILHIDMDAFFASIEEALNPDLKGKPIIVGGNPEGRGVVAAASYKAREYGIHSAMPLAMAKRLCPQAIFVHGNYSKYSEFSGQIMKIFDSYTPLVEPISLDEAFLDLSGCQKLHGHIIQTAERIREEIQGKIGINSSIGIASNKLIAKVASNLAKPNGLLRISAGKEQDFIALLPISILPGVGKKTEKILKMMGIRKIGNLTKIPKELLQKTFGKYGLSLYEKCRGICNSPVKPKNLVKSMGKEITFQTDTTDKKLIESTLVCLIGKVCSRMRRKTLKARCVSVKLRYSDFKTCSSSITLPEATALDKIIIKEAVRMLNKIFNRPLRVRLIGISLSSFSFSCHQTDLFKEKELLKMAKLYKGIDNIRDRYGFNSILTGQMFSNNFKN